MNVKTGDIRGAGTDSNVFLKIFGTKGDTGSLQLRQSENAWDKFERGRTDMFKVEAADIGKVNNDENLCSLDCIGCFISPRPALPNRY